MVLTVAGFALDTSWQKQIRKAPSTSSVLTMAVSVAKDETSIQVKSRITNILTRYLRGSVQDSFTARNSDGRRYEPSYGGTTRKHSNLAIYRYIGIGERAYRVALGASRHLARSTPRGRVIGGS